MRSPLVPHLHTSLIGAGRRERTRQRGDGPEDGRRNRVRAQ